MQFDKPTIDVTALQDLPESDPVQFDGLQFGGEGCDLTACQILISCVLANTSVG